MSTQFDEVRNWAVWFAIHERDLGVQEVGQENRGERIDAYQRASGVGLREGAAGRDWCGMFVYWCYRRAARRFNLVLPFAADDLWSGQKVVRWSRTHRESVVRSCPVRAGDIYVMNTYHIGMAIDASGEAEHFRSIDGNQSTGNSGRSAITTNQRLFSSCRLFVRI